MVILKETLLSLFHLLEQITQRPRHYPRIPIAAQHRVRLTRSFQFQSFLSPKDHCLLR